MQCVNKREQIYVSFSCVSPVNCSKFRQNIVKIVCVSQPRSQGPLSSSLKREDPGNEVVCIQDEIKTYDEIDYQ